MKSDKPTKRKRTRMEETTTPKKPASRTRSRNASATSAAASSGTIHRTTAMGESKIVWKDSPVEKHIKVSGTGKLAVRKEMQGFVGRLARASARAESPPTIVDELPTIIAATTDATPALVSRQAIGGINKGGKEPLSRHLLFSPEKNNTRSTLPCRLKGAQLAGTSSTSTEAVMRATGQSDSQDEMVSLLDQMNEKYSIDGASTLSSKAIVPLKAASTSVVKPATPATMPMHSPNPVNATAAPPPPPPPASLVFSTPKKQINRSPAPEGGGSSNSVEFGSPLTEESWDFLDQLEMQASQRILSSQQAHQQVSRPTGHLSGTSVAKRALPLSPAPLPTVGTVVYDKSVDVASIEDYKRLFVLEVDRDAHQRCLSLVLLDDQDKHIEAILMDDWYDTCVEAGDTVNIIFTEVDSAGFFSQNDQQPSSMTYEQTERVQVDNEQNLIIVFPDILVSPTSITTSFGCLRRAIICETRRVSSSKNQAAFLGTLKHELFEKAILAGQYDVKFLLEEAGKIVVSNILDIVDCGLNEEKTFTELRKVIDDYHIWLTAAFGSKGVAVNGPPAATNSSVKVHHVLATEEMMWSIKWGLKGATDASVEATLISRSDNSLKPTEVNVVLPIELKTGSKKFSGADHQGQVILYTLLLNERHRIRCQDGLLLYAPGIETNRIPAMASHIRGLLRARNKVAYQMAQVKAIGSATSSNAFPPMLRSRYVCGSCFQADQCYLHHAAIENGTPESSGLDEIFSEKIGHLTSTDLAYFKKWIRMIDLEQQHSEKSVRALWLEVGWKREQAQENCIAELELVSDEASHLNSGGKRTLRFQRNRRQRLAIISKPSDNTVPSAGSFLDLRLRVDDRVILSAESLDGKRVLVHVARGKIVSVDRSLITVDIMQSIPSTVKNGRTAIGKDFTWRLDKDVIVSALIRAKDNLVKLFVGPAPEITTNGTATDDRPGLAVSTTTPASNLSTMGDSRRRNLIVHLARPRFKSSNVVDLIQERCARDLSGLLKPQAPILIDEFHRLNVDQQRAVQKVLNSLDYALILGMPGTGKTSTIAFAVRLLIFMGFSVLVTSYTHSAVDNMLMKLLPFKIPMLRIGSAAQVHPLLSEYTLEHATNTQAISTVKGIEEMMQSAKLVGCTCLSVNHVLFRKRRFDFCIVDEATQTTQPVVLGALRCADTFVLVGDHYQLPPLVASVQARKEGMDVSLFRRLSEAHPGAIQHLSFQYRMNADIMLLANRLIYGNKLKCGSFQVATNQLPIKIGAYDQCDPIPWPFDVLKNAQGVTFLNTDTMGIASESRAGVSSSSGRRRMENYVEAVLIAGLIEVMIRGGINTEDIAVISPFHAQVSLIQSQLKLLSRDSSPSVEGVEVSTIDKYQGKDKDVILVSFVRCNPEKRVGELLADWRRINVALTRAKQKLLLVGSLSTLRDGCPLFHDLDQVIQSCQWEYRLATDGLDLLQKATATLRKSSSHKYAKEPDPERDNIPVRRADTQVSIYGLRRANDDIEGLVPDVVKISTDSRAPSKQLHPITRDIQGGF